MAFRRKADPGHELFPGFTDVREIGVGSLAVVFRAREIATGRMVALKLLNVRDASPRAIESFERESVALGALSSHPNIVTLYRTFRTPDGRPVLVLELCAGAVADQLHDGRGVPVPDAVAIGIKVAGALETAHRAGILHRDVKPQNILVTEFGEPALADFGVAMLQSSTQTTAGLFDFTTLHAAPELLEGGGTSAATDVYELASSLYQLIAGQSAFRAYEGESPASVILRILRDPVRPLSGANVPIALSDLLIRAMSKDMDSRPHTAAEFAAALAEVERAQGWGPTQFLAPTTAPRPVPSVPSQGWSAPAGAAPSYPVPPAGPPPYPAPPAQPQPVPPPAPAEAPPVEPRYVPAAASHASAPPAEPQHLPAAAPPVEPRYVPAAPALAPAGPQPVPAEVPPVEPRYVPAAASHASAPPAEPQHLPAAAPPVEPRYVPAAAPVPSYPVPQPQVPAPPVPIEVSPAPAPNDLVSSGPPPGARPVPHAGPLVPPAVQPAGSPAAGPPTAPPVPAEPRSPAPPTGSWPVPQGARPPAPTAEQTGSPAGPPPVPVAGPPPEPFVVPLAKPSVPTAAGPGGTPRASAEPPPWYPAPPAAPATPLPVPPAGPQPGMPPPPVPWPGMFAPAPGGPAPEPVDVPMWAVRTPPPEPHHAAAPLHAAGPQAQAPAWFDPASLPPRVRFRFRVCAVVVDEQRLRLRAGFRRTDIAWPDVLGFETRYADAASHGLGHIVARTRQGPVDLLGTRRPNPQLREIRALLDAYRIRASFTPRADHASSPY